VTLRHALGDNGFDEAWSEGAAMPTDEAIAYAQRGRGGRKRSTSGWESLTPAELNVVGLVSEGLSNKDIAERLFRSCPCGGVKGFGRRFPRRPTKV